MTTVSTREKEVLDKLFCGHQPELFATPQEIRSLERAGLIERSISFNWSPTARATETQLEVQPENPDAYASLQDDHLPPIASNPLEFAQVKTQYGPTGFIGRTLLRIEEEVAERGVELEVVALDTLLDINKQVAGGWFPLISIFDPAFNDLNDENSFAIVGRDKHGNVVTCNAARFLDWTDTNFVNEAESLRLFYSDPKKYRLRAESCQVTSLAAKAITGRITFTGAAWLRQDFRRKGLFQLLPRLNRLYAYTRWNTDLTVTVMMRERVEAGGLKRPGHLNAEWGLKLFNSRLGTKEFCVKWLQPNELLKDAKLLLDQLDHQPAGKLEIDI